MMPVIIHTCGRPRQQFTLGFIRHLRQPVSLLVQKQEEDKYRLVHPQANIMVLPDNIRMLSPTRQWIMDWARDNNHEKVCMIDDDLRFFKRRPPTGENKGSFSLLNASPEEIQEMFDHLEEKLNEYAHVGISAREGNNHVERDFVEVTRMMRLLAYRTEVFHTCARFDRIDTKQDFDVTLQMLRAGHKNYVSYIYGQGQAAGSGSAGGCATYRDHDMMTRCAEELAALHPGFVRVDEKETKTSFGGGVRKDVTISWKKAYESSKEK